MPWSSNVCTTVIREERSGAAFTVVPHAVEQGASLLLSVVQDSLRWMSEFGYGRPAERSLIELWTLQQAAVNAAAAVCPGGRSAAKALQLKASSGKPLTVCVGDLAPRRLPDDFRNVLDPEGVFDEDEDIPTIDWNDRGSGCGAICADSIGTRRPAFRRWCESCGTKTTWRQNARLAAIEGN